MRFKINLASQPYENARRFFLEWGVALGILLIFSGLLVFAAARTWRADHALARSIADERARLERLNDQEKADLEILNKGANKEVRERAQAINALILRKEFSWTRIFTDLEKMMPSRLHVVSIAPALTENGDIEIRMSVAGDSRDKAIELVQNIEKAPDFRDPRILSETSASRERPATAGDSVEFQIAATYVPSAAQVISDTEKQQGAKAVPEPSTTDGRTAEGREPKTGNAARDSAKGGRP